MAKSKKRLIKSDFGRYAAIFLIILGMIFVFTAIDYLIHSLSPEYAVPQEYFRNKIIFGTIYGFIACLLFRKQKLFVKSVLFSGIISVLLQARYYLQGYPKDFVFLFLGIHFVILLAVSLIAFKSARKFM